MREQGVPYAKTGSESLVCYKGYIAESSFKDREYQLKLHPFLHLTFWNTFHTEVITIGFTLLSPYPKDIQRLFPEALGILIVAYGGSKRVVAVLEI